MSTDIGASVKPSKFASVKDRSDKHHGVLCAPLFGVFFLFLGRPIFIVVLESYLLEIILGLSKVQLMATKKVKEKRYK
jgi:hypothetical protein